MYYGLINSMNKTVAPSYTARTTAFATATGITDTTILGALNTFDLGLISNSLDTKMKAIYPFVGGTSTTQKFNFMDARDLNAAFRLQFSGGGTFSATGYKPNGTNAYADTFFKPITNGSLTANNNHIAIYSRTSAGSDYYNAGAETFPAANALNIFVNRTDGSAGYDSGTYTLNRNSYSNGDGKGYYLGTVNSDLSSRAYKNGILKNTTSITNMALTDVNVYLATTNPINLYTSQEMALFHIGTGLSSADCISLSTLVQNLQTSLGRQV